MNILAIIPARGGSKSIPDKNIQILGKKPLIAWSIEIAKKCISIGRVVVSTDNEKISSVSKEFGAEVIKRPGALAQDNSLVKDAILHVLGQLQKENDYPDIIVLLEPTCPFRNVSDIQHCIDLLIQENLDSVATFKQASLNPHRAWKITNNKPDPFISGVNPWLPRQQLPEAYQLNGAVYAFKPSILISDSPSLLQGEIGAVIMPDERSIDIDTPEDLNLARQKAVEHE